MAYGDLQCLERRPVGGYIELGACIDDPYYNSQVWRITIKSHVQPSPPPSQPPPAAVPAPPNFSQGVRLSFGDSAFRISSNVAAGALCLDSNLNNEGPSIGILVTAVTCSEVYGRAGAWQRWFTNPAVDGSVILREWVSGSGK
jgi:hypothetical protein